ncbi:MAG: GTPase, partial [Gemmatimonadota bacterium]
LAVEDGPSLTHGDLPYGAASLAAREYGASDLVDPRPFAVGSLVKIFEKFPNAGPLLPAMGYGAEQISELAETIRRSDAEVVAIGTPVDLTRVLSIDVPTVRVTYDLVLDDTEGLDSLLRKALEERESRD